VEWSDQGSRKGRWSDGGSHEGRWTDRGSCKGRWSDGGSVRAGGVMEDLMRAGEVMEVLNMEASCTKGPNAFKWPGRFQPITITYKVAIVTFLLR